MRQPRQEGRPARPRPRPRLTHRPASRLDQAWRGQRSTTRTSSSSPDDGRGGRSRYHSTCLSGRGGPGGPCGRGSGSSLSPARHRSRPPGLARTRWGVSCRRWPNSTAPTSASDPRPAPHSPADRYLVLGVLVHEAAHATHTRWTPSAGRSTGAPATTIDAASHWRSRGSRRQRSAAAPLASPGCTPPRAASFLADFFTPTCTSTLALRPAPLQLMHRVRLPPAAAHHSVTVRSGLMPVRLWCRGQAWRLGRRWRGVIDTRPDQPARTPPPGTRDVSGATGVRAQHHPPARTHRHHRQPPPATGRAGCRPPSSPTTTHRRAIATASPR
jgi:hypothetical protein